MSRSYRKPYHAITTCESAKDDKRRAHRGERRAQNQALHTAVDYENLLLPDKLECSWNNTYSWGRDGGKHYHGKGSRRSHWDSATFIAEISRK